MESETLNLLCSVSILPFIHKFKSRINRICHLQFELLTTVHLNYLRVIYISICGFFLRFGVSRSYLCFDIWFNFGLATLFFFDYDERLGKPHLLSWLNDCMNLIDLLINFSWRMHHWTIRLSNVFKSLTKSFYTNKWCQMGSCYLAQKHWSMSCGTANPHFYERIIS